MVEAAGIEPGKADSLRGLSAHNRVGSDGDPHAATTDAHATPAHPGQASIDPLERALLLAAEAGRFDVVAKLADELHARRLVSAGNVAVLSSKKPSR